MSNRIGRGDYLCSWSVRGEGDDGDLQVGSGRGKDTEGLIAEYFFTHLQGEK